MKKNKMTAVYSAAHFFVDLACAFLIFRYVCSFPQHSEYILVYNFCAFALQMPFGILIDRFGKGHAAAGVGCFLTASAYAFGGFSSPEAALLSAAAAGVGNALFHVGGGVYVLDEYDSSGALGVFVSPGAIGLFLGTIWGKGSDISPVIPVLSMIICGMLILIMPRILRLAQPWGRAAETPQGFRLSGKHTAAAVMLFIVVVFRSMGGFMAALPWKTGYAAAAAILLTAGGKALGGFASDRFGMRRTAVFSLAAAAVFYLFSDKMLWGLMAILLFNMSMPITLRAAADIFKGGRGFSFGLLTFALFIGYIPPYLSRGAVIGADVMAVICLISMLLLAGGCVLCRGNEK